MQNDYWIPPSHVMFKTAEVSGRRMARLFLLKEAGKADDLKESYHLGDYARDLREVGGEQAVQEALRAAHAGVDKGLSHISSTPGSQKLKAQYLKDGLNNYAFDLRNHGLMLKNMSEHYQNAQVPKSAIGQEAVNQAKQLETTAHLGLRDPVVKADKAARAAPSGWIPSDEYIDTAPGVDVNPFAKTRPSRLPPKLGSVGWVVPPPSKRT